MALLLMLLPLLLPMVVSQSECPLDSVVNLKIQAALAGYCPTPQEPGEVRQGWGGARGQEGIQSGCATALPVAAPWGAPSPA